MGQYSSSASQGEASAGQASLAIVNAVPSDKNLFVSFDGESIWPPGFVPGQSTASVMFSAGKKKLRVECEGFASAEGVLELPTGANCAAVFYSGEIANEGPDKGKRKIGVFLPTPHPPTASAPKDVSFKVVLVGATDPVELHVNGKKEVFLPSKTRLMGGLQQGLFSIEHKGSELLKASPDEPGEYLVVVYPSANKLSAVLLNHSPFKVPSE